MTIRQYEAAPNAAPAQILVIVANYRTGPCVIDCLRSLHPQVQSLRGTHVTVADNASSDGSVEKIRTAINHDGFGNWANVMELERNGGFAYANNAVIRCALEDHPAPDYFLLLNPDTLVRPGALPALLEFMETHRQVGIAGSRLEYLDGTPQDTAR
ncbi:MAG: glycosyltransferase, partial [Pirellulaceae bacterium]|nr:glycosyltransferase [Pirellulaceae bacterium]